MAISRFHMVFTPAGCVFLAAALFIFVRSMIARNSYEILLSSAALLFLLVTGIFGAWKSRKLVMDPGWKPPSPMTANAGDKTQITGIDPKVPVFFRLHFVVKGRFFPSGSSGGCPVLAETSVSRGETTAQLPLDFPVSGVFQGEGICRLRDVFGFYSFSCGQPQHRIVKVRSAPCFGKDYHISAQSGAEDQRNKTSSDEERYYMREYTPGDRFRDINWKSSEKIDSLITRISPDNQEKVSRIEVYLRNFGPAKKTSMEALWMLDRTKARLSHFLRNLMEQQASFVFNVHTANESREIENSESLDEFLDDIAGLPFSQPQNEDFGLALSNLAASKSGELYVFSTACDRGLNGFLLACSPRPVSLFLAQPADRKKEMAHNKTAEPEILHRLDFPAKGCVPFPRWFISDKISQTGANASRVEMLYTETRL